MLWSGEVTQVTSVAHPCFRVRNDISKKSEARNMWSEWCSMEVGYESQAEPYEERGFFSEV